jgi:serine/threonine protein kinase
MSVLVGGRFRTIGPLASGGFGKLYKGEELKTRIPVAIKTERPKWTTSVLETESRMYSMIAGAIGFPEMKFYGNEGQLNVLVIDLLGKSVATLFEECGYHFSMKTVLMLADQMISRVEYLHAKGIIHGDIKPENFVLGKEKNSNQLYLIDFGMSGLYRDPETHRHVRCGSCEFYGTARFASINAHRRRRLARRDDLESLAYTLIYLATGSLPWQDFCSEDKAVKIMRAKEAAVAADLAKGLPKEFADFVEMVKKLDFCDTVIYEDVRNMFRNLMLDSGFAYDYDFDWTLQKNGSE